MTDKLTAGMKKAWAKPQLKSISAGSAEKSAADENVADGQGQQKS